MKAAAKHTPGPWAASSAYGGGHALWIAPENGAPMVLQGANCLRSDTIKYEQISIDQLQANAALIAAAPELLESVMNLVALDSNWANQDDAGKRHWVAAIDQARAAIAKATGGAA